MKNFAAVLCLGALVLVVIPQASGCGGCDSSAETDSACEQTRLVTSTESYRDSYRCGWFWSRRRCYRTRYRTVTRSVTENMCCAGYELAGSTCRRNDCGRSQYSNAGERLTQIVGGIEALPNEFPWQIRILRDGGFICGGSIITPSHVLTAAHCVDDNIDPARLTVVAGDHERTVGESTQQNRGVAAVTVHAEYDETYLDGDIAMLELDAPLVLGTTAREACLPASGQQFVGESVVISGWGLTVDGGATSDALMYTLVTVTSCDAVYARRTNRHTICGTDGRGDTDRSSCQGDSGGPMVLKQDGRFVLLGVSSFVHIDGCAAGKPFGYTDVSRYTDWIESHSRTDNCGRSKYPDAGEALTQIVGGIEARANEFPWQVRVLYNSQFRCGGVIISDRHVLLTTECIRGLSTSLLSVVAGDHSRSSSESTTQTRSVTRAHTHTGYVRNRFYNDIGLLELATPLTLNENVAPACLPAPDGSYVGQSVVISGWGQIEGSAYPDVLQYTVVTVTSLSTCQRIFRQNFQNVVCALGSGGRGPCYGDGGGPMVLNEGGRFVVIGVSSFMSSRACSAGYPSGYTDVSRYIDWIEDKTGLDF